MIKKIIIQIKSLLIFNTILSLLLFSINSVHATDWNKAQTSKEGIVDMMEVLPEYLQVNSTAENRDFHIKRNERSLGTGTQYYFYLEGGTVTVSMATNGIFRIGSATIGIDNNRIGIGTTTPSTALHVIGTVTATSFSGSGAGITGISSFNGGTITNSLQVVGTVTATSFSGNGAGLTGVPATVAFNAVTGSVSTSQLPPIIELSNTSTVITSTSTSARWYNLQQTGAGDVIAGSYALLLHYSSGSLTTDSSGVNLNLVVGGNVVGTSTGFGINFGNTAYYDGTGDVIKGSDTASLALGSSDFEMESKVRFSALGANRTILSQGSDGSSNLAFWFTYSVSNLLYFRYSTNGTAETNLSVSWTPSIDTDYHLEIDRSGTTLYFFANGSLLGTQSIGADSIYNSTDDLYVGAQKNLSGQPSQSMSGYMDETRLIVGAAQHTSAFSSPTQQYNADNYNYCSTQYIPPGTTTPKLSIIDSGTQSTKTYLVADVTTAIFGIGTTTVPGTTTGTYSLYVAGAARVEALDIASTEKIKKNIKDITISPALLDAEAEAKARYIADKRGTWTQINESAYTYVGSDTATYVDTVALENGYNDYIELEWASDLYQNVYITGIQKAHERGFWKIFGKVQARSWNPISKPNVTREGFIAGEMPDVVKGEDGESIKVMTIIAYMSLVNQKLKENVVFALSMLKELTTGTVTQSQKDEIAYRLDVLSP